MRFFFRWKHLQTTTALWRNLKNILCVCVCAQDLNKRQGLALLSKVGESVKHVAGGYKLRARPAEFSAMGDYLDTFSQKLGTIDRIAQRILKEQSGSAPPSSSTRGRPCPRHLHTKLCRESENCVEL